MAENSKRVVMVSAGFYPYLVGGAERQALELSVALLRRGVSVRVLTRRLPGLAAREEVRGVEVLRLWRFSRGAVDAASFMASLFIWLLWHASDYDVVHVHLAGSPALPAAMAGRLLGKRVVVKIGGGRGIGELAVSARTPAGRFKLKLLSWLKPQFVAVAAELAEEAARYLGGMPVYAMPNGVDTERFHPEKENRRAEIRSAFGWPRGLGFIYAGRLSVEKRLPWFLEIWAEIVQKTGTDAFIAFIGEGPEKDLIARAAADGRVGAKVFFHAPVEDPSPAYAAADVFVLPSVSEGLSNALLEAMSSGLAVLASRVGGTAEAVVEARCGFLFEPGNREDLRVQLRKFLDHPALAASLGEESRKRVEERYSMESVVARYEALYGFQLPD